MIVGERVRLRPFREDDLDALWAMVNDEEGNRLTGTHATFTRDAVERWYRSRGEQEDRLDLVIANLTDDTCVGEVVLSDIDHDNRSAGFRIALAGPHVYGQGFGSEATRLMLGHAFGGLGLHRVELEVYEFNHRAIHVYTEAGFTVEGVRRDALYWEGSYHDALIMSVLEHECG